MTEENEQQVEPQQAKTNLRNRLVGSVILVAAGVIIIPSLLDGRKVSYKDEFKQIPEPGKYQTVQSNKPFPKNEFDQHLPKNDTPSTDEEPVDAAELENFAETAGESNQSKEVLNNGTVVVNTMPQPIDFDQSTPTDNPQVNNEQVNNEQARNETEKQQTAVKEKPKATTKPVQKSSPFTDNAWVIQLGVFGKKANVAALEKRLNDAGFATFNRDIKYRNGKVLTKVYVGPELDKSVLAKSLTQVNKLAGVNGKIAAFDVKN